MLTCQRQPKSLPRVTQDWGDDLLGALKQAGGKVYSNYAVGYNNVDVKAATKHGLPVGNTPGAHACFLSTGAGQAVE